MSLNKSFLKYTDVRYLVVHCSDTPNGSDLDATCIHELHLSFGWDGIGYHRLIKRNGEIQMGRPDYWVGAHVYGFNKMSLGVCLIGRDDFTEKQFSSLKIILRMWKKNCPNARILGHCDLTNTEKTCPNFQVIKWCRDSDL